MRGHVSGIYNITNYIKRVRFANRAGVASTFLFGLLVLAIVFPLYKIDRLEDTEAATAYTSSTSSITVASTGRGAATITADSSNLSTSGAFISSDYSDTSQVASFNVTTNNATGYTLSIASNNATTSLTNGTTTLASLPSNTTTNAGLTATAFNTDTYNNTWGYMPSKVNSAANTKYYPMTNTARTLDVTSAANSTAINYTIGLGARLNYGQAAGEYKVATGTNFTLTAVGNASTYTINYDANGGSGAPDQQASTSFTQQSVKLSATTPTKTGYDFKGWCTAKTSDQAGGTAGNTACSNASGTYYASGATYYINEQTKNTDTLYAIWSIKTFSCFIQSREQGTDGNYGSYTTRVNSTVNYGGTCSWSVAATASHKAASYSNTNVTANVSQSLDIERNSYTVTISNSNTTSSASSLTVYYGGSKTVDVTPNSGYYLSAVSCPSGYSCTGYNTGASYTGKQTVTVTNNNSTNTSNTLSFTGAVAKQYLQDFTSTTCSGLTQNTNYTFYDKRDENDYTVAKLADGYCWMTQNLRLGKGNGETITLTSSDSNVSSNFALKASGMGSKTPDATGDCNVGDWYPSSTAQYLNVSHLCINTSDTAKYGVYYNWYTATAGTGTYSTGANVNATSSICPKGWILPPNSGERSYYNLITTKLGGASSATLQGTPYNFPLSGYTYGAGISNVGSGGYFWSSTAYNNTDAYRLYLDTSSVDPQGNRSKGRGSSVRCVFGS